LGVVFCTIPATSQEIYLWVDEKGSVHFADDLSQVPEKYRDQIQTKKLPKETPTPVPSAPGTPKPPSGPAPKQPVPVPQPPARKDALGRGEDWWRDQVKQWNAKLNEARQNHATALSELKDKQKELEEAKLKPESLKRKLRAEMKVLEDKVNEAKNREQEATNMIQKELPKQAADYRADPNWLK
jgi:hypothetical protein